MGAIILVEVIGVFLAWAVAGYTIWKWGPGLRMRSVRCPEIKAHARVLAEQQESEFGCLRVTDVKVCSLLHVAVPDCKKACMARL